MTAVMRLADARLSASIITSCSMIISLIGSECVCTTKASAPRTLSSDRT